MVSKTSIPVVGNVRFNAVCAALIYSLVHSDTAFNYIIICFMQCSKWTVRRKEELQAGLLSWYSGGLRLRIITCYSINSVLIHSKGQVWLARAIFIWCFLTFISLVLPKIFLFFIWLWFGLFGFFGGRGLLGCDLYLSYTYYSSMQEVHCSGIMQIKFAAISYFYLLETVRQTHKVNILFNLVALSLFVSMCLPLQCYHLFSYSAF